MQERTITELQGAVSKIKKLDGKIWLS
jgi:hypothetical protein